MVWPSLSEGHLRNWTRFYYLHSVKSGDVLLVLKGCQPPFVVNVVC